jgi:hypothetical protein
MFERHHKSSQMQTDGDLVTRCKTLQLCCLSGLLQRNLLSFQAQGTGCEWSVRDEISGRKNLTWLSSSSLTKVRHIHDIMPRFPLDLPLPDDDADDADDADADMVRGNAPSPPRTEKSSAVPQAACVGAGRDEVVDDGACMGTEVRSVGDADGVGGDDNWPREEDSR